MNTKWFATQRRRRREEKFTAAASETKQNCLNLLDVTIVYLYCFRFPLKSKINCNLWQWVLRITNGLSCIVNAFHWNLDLNVHFDFLINDWTIFRAYVLDLFPKIEKFQCNEVIFSSWEKTLIGFVHQMHFVNHKTCNCNHAFSKLEKNKTKKIVLKNVINVELFNVLRNMKQKKRESAEVIFF